MAIAQDTPICQNSNPQDRRGSISIYNKAYYEANKEKKKAYRKAYRESNKDRIQEYNKEHRESHKEYCKAYYEANKDSIKENKKTYYEANKEKIKCYTKAYREANKNRIQEYNKAYMESNKDKMNIHWRNRRARKRNAEGSHTSADIQQLLTLQRKKCAVCHTSITKGYHVDHVIPLVMNGSNGKDNLQLLCPPCNLSKNAKHPVDFMQERGFLL